MTLKTVATELDAFLKSVSPKTEQERPRPRPTEPAPKTEVEKAVAAKTAAQMEAEALATHRRKLVRAAWDYVSSRLNEEDDSRTIGEAFMLAVAGLAQDAQQPVEALNSVAIEFLEEIVDVARESL